MFYILFYRNDVRTGKPLTDKTHCLTFEGWDRFAAELKKLESDEDFTVISYDKSAHYAE